MPAINPSRLEIQIEKLLNYFGEPGTFHKRLGDIFGFYANRTLNFGSSAEPGDLTPRYHLPYPLIRQLQLAAKPYIVRYPQKALACADELWKDDFLEVKQFAIFILGSIPLDEPDLILTRLQTWIEPDLDKELKADLLALGTENLQKNFPMTWEKLIQSFLEQKDPKMINLGIQGLIEGLQRTKTEGFPLVFRMISPIIQNPHGTNLKMLENLIETLIRKSAIETAFFLKQTLSLSQSTETRRLIKRCLTMLPEMEAQDLKASLDGSEKSFNPLSGPDVPLE